MQKTDFNNFSFAQMFCNSVTGKTSLGAVCAFMVILTGLLTFTIIVIMVLFSKDSAFIGSLITLATLSVGLVTLGGTVVFGNKVADSKEVLADINSLKPLAANITNVQTDKAIVNPPTENL